MNIQLVDIRPLLPTHQVKFFQEQGYLLLRGLLPADALQSLRAEFERAVERQAYKWFREGKIQDRCEALPFEMRYAALREQLPVTFSNSWRRILVSRALFDIWQQPELLGVMRSLIGGEIYAHGTWNGRPRVPKQLVQTIGWHQDGHYYKDYQVSDEPIITCWMPLVPVDERSGCLQVLPAYHKGGLRPMARLPRNNLVGLSDEAVAGYQVLSCAMQPGDVLMFNGLTAHRATDNNSDRVRWSLDIRYCSADHPHALANAGYGYYCYSQDDPSRVEAFETWSAKYDYEGEF